MSETLQTPQLSGKMFLFERPELLSKEQHGSHGVTKIDRPYSFCANIRAVPLTLSEIIPASRDYPIVFTGEKKAIPLAVLGIVDDVNLFVNDEGHWDTDAYIPAYIRRYPFSFAAETGGDRMAIVVDAAFEGIVEGGERPLFLEDGQPSDVLQGSIEFCKQYEQDRQRTDQFFDAVEPFGLVAGQAAQFTPVGSTEQAQIAQYHGFDEQRLRELPDEQFLELRRQNILPFVFAQLSSLSNWRVLVQKRARRFNLTETDVLQPLARA